MNVHVAELPIGFLARLKAQTRPEHEAIEAALGLMGDGLTTDMYRYTLERFYGFFGHSKTVCGALPDGGTRAQSGRAMEGPTARNGPGKARR